MSGTGLANAAVGSPNETHQPVSVDWALPSPPRSSFLPRHCAGVGPESPSPAGTLPNRSTTLPVQGLLLHFLTLLPTAVLLKHLPHFSSIHVTLLEAFRGDLADAEGAAVGGKRAVPCTENPMCLCFPVLLWMWDTNLGTGHICTRAEGSWEGLGDDAVGAPRGVIFTSPPLGCQQEPAVGTELWPWLLPPSGEVFFPNLLSQQKSSPSSLWSLSV